MAAPAIFGILTGIDESFPVSFSELREFAVIPVVTASLAGKERAQAMMEIVVPLRVQAVPAALSRSDQARIVIGAFGNEKNLAVEAHRLSMHGIAQFFEKRDRGMVKHAVNQTG